MRFTLHPILWLVSLSFLISPQGDIKISANEAPPAMAVETSVLTDASKIDPIKISIYNEDTSVQPGRPFFVAVQIKIQENWYTYWKNPGQVGMAPEITWNLPEGFEAGKLIWPTPQRLTSEQGVKFGYEKNLTFLAEIKPSKSFSQEEATIKANVRWIVCSDSSCLPGETPISINIAINNDEPKKAEDYEELFTSARANVPKKHEAITAKRNQNGLIEIGFHDSSAKMREIADAEFFPEHKKAIDINVPTFVQSSNNSKDHTIILKETSLQPSIKGVLVLHTPTGLEAYEIDAPINPAEGSESLISEASSLGARQQTATQHSFEFEGGLALAILLAFMGGMILNLMPCVLPVISLKILGFIKLAGQSRKLIFQHGAAFSIGVLLSFWVLAGLLLILQAYGRSVGWGFQLQEPIFVGILAALLFMFGLSLFGVFEVGTSIMSAAGGVEQKAGKNNQLLSSFFSGVLATAVATPCTGPFLGSAIGYAFTLPAFKTMMIFTSLGLGMSFPYIAISAFPALLRFLPKPGPWMITFKELMGFLMMASVIWLVWVFSAQTNGLAVTMLLVGFFLFAIACWIYGRWATPLRKKMTRMIGTAVALVFISIGAYVLTVSTSSWVDKMGGSITSKNASSEVSDGWEEFSAERVEELRKQGIPVFIDFTAKWCLICQTNHIVLTGEEVESKFKERGVVKMKADWTKKDEVIAAELRKFGRNSVPLYVFYDDEPEAAPKILPQVLTSDIVLGSIE
jgi:thiol:disulfide interchange protein